MAELRYGPLRCPSVSAVRALLVLTIAFALASGCSRVDLGRFCERTGDCPDVVDTDAGAGTEQDAGGGRLDGESGDTGDAATSCLTDADCPEDAICESGACVRLVVPGCTTSAECPPNSQCVAGVCEEVVVPPECVSESDCPAGFFCGLEGRCLERGVGCVDAFDCGPGETCDEGACTTPECAVPEDCGAGATCEEGACVPFSGCVRDAQCGPSRICVSGACIPAPEGCTDDRDCGLEAVCQSGVCVTGECRFDAECAEGLLCDAGRCVAAVSCSGPEECAFGEVCLAGFCAPGLSCTYNETCGFSALCIDGGCVFLEPECFESSDCAGLTCANGRCESVSTCSSDFECPGTRGVCIGGICRDAVLECRDNADCSGGRSCVGARCVR